MKNSLLLLACLLLLGCSSKFVTTSGRNYFDLDENYTFLPESQIVDVKPVSPQHQARVGNVYFFDPAPNLGFPTSSWYAWNLRYVFYDPHSFHFCYQGNQHWGWGHNGNWCSHGFYHNSYAWGWDWRYYSRPNRYYSGWNFRSNKSRPRTSVSNPPPASVSRPRPNLNSAPISSPRRNPDVSPPVPRKIYSSVPSVQPGTTRTQTSREIKPQPRNYSYPARNYGTNRYEFPVKNQSRPPYSPNRSPQTPVRSAPTQTTPKSSFPRQPVSSQPPRSSGGSARPVTVPSVPRVSKPSGEFVSPPRQNKQ